MRIGGVAIAATLLLSSAAVAQELELQIELMGPLGTKTSHKGDRVFGRVVRPEALKGDTVEGAVKEVHSGGKLHGNSVLNFSFDTLQHAGQAIPVSTQIKSFQNSHGQADVDEEGRIIRKGGGNTGKALAGTGAGGLIGGLAGGLKGAAIGAGVGAAASIAVIEIACDSPDIRFDPGSLITVIAKTRNGGPAITDITGSPANSEATPAPSTPAYAPIAGPITANAPAGRTSDGGPAAAAPASQPDFTVLKDDFIPGSKTLLYDDFTDMEPDEAPPHWKVRGASLTMMGAGGIRQLTATDDCTLTPMVNGFPNNFTLEAETRYVGYVRKTWRFYPKGSADNEVLEVWTETRSADNLLRFIVRVAGEGGIVDSDFPVDLSQPVREALWVQNGRLRVYLNGTRIVDANQLKLPDLERAVLIEQPDHSRNASASLRSVRIAESTPDFSRSIMATGRYITYGILFDTDSDHVKPESAGVIKSIAGGLRTNGDLKLRIEGHTDSSGNDAHNLDLSKRRAEAVRTILVSEFQIDGGRLTADGLGSSKPITGNDTPQGRQQNRRVEFVKQ